jgi:beta-carotene 3-hydroxylase
MLYVATFLATVLTMEGVAWVMHKYLMHGPLWVLHESHHRRREGAFERNDAFGIFFALPSMVLIWFGVRGHPYLLAIGIGMTAYGALYFFFHDVLVHRRLPMPFVPTRGYLHRVVRAHLVHHRATTKEGAVSFGFLFAGNPEKLKQRLARNQAALRGLPSDAPGDGPATGSARPPPSTRAAAPSVH